MYKLFCFEAFIYIIVLDLLQSFKRRSQAKIKIQVKIIFLEQLTYLSRDLKHFEYNVLNKNSHVTKDKTSRVKYKI